MVVTTILRCSKLPLILESFSVALHKGIYVSRNTEVFMKIVLPADPPSPFILGVSQLPCAGPSFMQPQSRTAVTENLFAFVFFLDRFYSGSVNFL